MRDRPPGTVKIDSKVYPLADISELGFVIDHYEGDLIAKQRIYFDLIMPVQDKDETFRAEAVVVRIENKRLFARFNDLRRDARHAIQNVVSHANAVPARPARPN